MRSPYAAEPAAPPAEVAAPTRTPQGKVREKLDQSKPKSFRTYSRFGRDPEVYFWTIDHVLYGLARAAANATNVIRVWSAGCAGGEEPYSLAIAWSAVLAERFPAVRLEIVATDVDENSLRRAKAGVFDVHAVANLPVEWVASCFQLLDDGRYELSEEIRGSVSFSKGDAVSDAPPEGPFDLVLARYSLFLYLAPEDARRALEKVQRVLKGTLVTGLSDSLPQDHALQCVQGAPNGVYRPGPEPQSPNDGRPATLTELLGLEERLGTKREPPPKRVTVSRGSRRILEKTSRGEDPFPEHRFPRTASMGVAPEPENLERPRTAVAFGSTGPLPASPPRRPRSARVAPPEPARRPAPPPAPARRKKVLPEAARAALFDRLQRPASAPAKRPVKSHSGPTWIIKSEPRPEYVAPPRKSLKSADARKVVERLYTADCARREERVQANAKAYFRPAKRRRRKGKKAVRSFLSRLRRSDAKRKKRLKAIRDAVFAAERGVERTAEDAVGLQNLSRLAAAPRPPPPTRRPPPPPANSLSGSSGSSGGGSSGRLAFSTGTGASGSRGQFVPTRPRTTDQGYTSRCARPRSARTAPVAPTRPTVRYRMSTAVGAVEVAASPSGKLRHGPKRMDVTSLLRRAYCEPKVLLAPP
jgi:chemotaxis methyl-accepting protein methylase/uncharacterized membrane protein YgcG